MHQQQGHQARADDIACHAAEERLSPWLVSIAAHDQRVRAGVVRRVEQQDAGTPARLGGDVAVFRGDAVPGKMVENRWDVAVIAIANRDHQNAIGGDQKRQRGGKCPYGLGRTVPCKCDIIAWTTGVSAGASNTGRPERAKTASMVLLEAS